MNDRDHSRTEHPEELLAGYVDGSASAEERRSVDAHLAGCSRCRDELALAGAARAAIRSLPELEAPGLAAGGIEGLRAARGDELAAQRERRRRRQWQASWVAIGAAAAVVTLFVVVPLAMNRDGGGTPGAALAPTDVSAESAKYPPVLQRSFDYNQASVLALARRLADQAREGQLLSGSDRPTRMSGAPKALDASTAEIVECAARAIGLPRDTVPVHLERATYRGTPAFVVAVLNEGGTRPHLRVYAISQQGCTFLFEADQPI